MPAATTVPCQYRTGKTLGSGTYAVVKEAVHIKTGKYYACKVINKGLMAGREKMVQNEISVLKKVSSGHRNIVTLHDYFETAHNLYLIFDLCTGGELFDEICRRGNFYESDAAKLVKTIMKAVAHIHEAGIVHRDLKPENLLFRNKEKDADIMIADFGLSRVIDDAKLTVLTEVCGTPGYMAPEIFRKVGHGKAVDIWAMGVITYFLLCGYTPFDRDTQQEEMQAICRGDYRFEPAEYWQGVSETGRDFVRTCLTMDQRKRPTATQMLEHAWLKDIGADFVESDAGAEPVDLLPNLKKQFDARKTFRRAVLSIAAASRFNSLGANLSPQHAEIKKEVSEYKEAAEAENMDDDQMVTTYSDSNTPPNSAHLKTSHGIEPSSPKPPTNPSAYHPQFDTSRTSHEYTPPSHTPPVAKEDEDLVHRMKTTGFREH